MRRSKAISFAFGEILKQTHTAEQQTGCKPPRYKEETRNRKTHVFWQSATRRDDAVSQLLIITMLDIALPF